MKKGFSLIELLITTILLSIVFSFTIPTFNTMVKKSRFQTEAKAIFELLLDTRNAALAGKVCEDSKFYFYLPDSENTNIEFGCNRSENFVLKESVVIFPNPEKIFQTLNKVSIYFEGNPFQMKVVAGSLSPQKSYFEIQSENLKDTEVWTVCLDTIKGFPELYEKQCDCDDFHKNERDSFPKCS